MDRQQIGLKLALDQLGVPARLSSFDDRLVLQKTVYLAQTAGVDLGYGFQWYLRGPYSPALTRDAFSMVSELKGELDESQGWHLDEASVGRLKELKALIPGGQSQRASRLELLASVHFLLRRGHRDAELHEVLERYGKHYTEDQIREAAGKLREYGLLEGQK